MDLFDAIRKLFRKEPIKDPPSDFMLHRFLASQRDFAPFCAEINLYIKNRELTWGIWKAALPKAASAPYLPYPAPKKQYPDDPFIEGLMEELGVGLLEAQEIAEIVELEGKTQEVANYYGIDYNVQ